VVVDSQPTHESGGGNLPLTSVKATATIPTAGYHRLLASINYIQFVTEAHGCV